MKRGHDTCGLSHIIRLFPPANEVWGKVMFSREKGALHPVGADLHPGGLVQTPPQHRILQDTVNESAIRILLECIPVCFCLHQGSGKVQTVLTTLRQVRIQDYPNFGQFLRLNFADVARVIRALYDIIGDVWDLL